MERKEVANGWELDFCFPLQKRATGKPRFKGITMILDKGIGLRKTLDLLEMCGEYIDFWKLGFASSALYRPEILKKKIEMVNSYKIKIYPGGTFLEIALAQGKQKAYLQRARELDFSAVEISDGTIELPAWKRSQIIKAALERGLMVLTEIGKKDSCAVFHPELIAEQINKDLEDGAFKVILEARESGKNVTIFNEQGNIELDKMNRLLMSAGKQDQIIWEAPLKKQQLDFMAMFGPNVNLGNILPEDVLALESLRSGLRADTFRMALAKEVKLENKALFGKR